jgi:HSP20 family protein
MWFDEAFDQEFRRLSNRFFHMDDIFETPFGNNLQTIGPYYYGYSMTLGPDGKPRVKEWGNVRPTSAIANSDVRAPLVDDILDKDNKTLKLVAEMPGIEKNDIKITVEDKAVHISAENDKRKYKTKTPLKYKVDENSAKASYANGILEIRFTLAEEKPKGKQIAVD